MPIPTWRTSSIASSIAFTSGSARRRGCGRSNRPLLDVKLRLPQPSRRPRRHLRRTRCLHPHRRPRRHLRRTRHPRMLPRDDSARSTSSTPKGASPSSSCHGNSETVSPCGSLNGDDVGSRLFGYSLVSTCKRMILSTLRALLVSYAFPPMGGGGVARVLATSRSTTSWRDSDRRDDSNAHVHLIADVDDFARIAQEAAVELRHVNQPVLMHADAVPSCSSW